MWKLVSSLHICSGLKLLPQTIFTSLQTHVRMHRRFKDKCTAVLGILFFGGIDFHFLQNLFMLDGCNHLKLTVVIPRTFQTEQIPSFSNMDILKASILKNSRTYVI